MATPASDSSDSTHNDQYPPGLSAEHSKTIQTFDVEEAGPVPDTSYSPGSRWASRIRRQSARFPRISAALFWLRGPRPKVDLPDPKPLLDIDVTIRGRHIYLPIEKTWLRYVPKPPWYLLVLLFAGYIVSLAFFARAQFFLTPASDFIGCTAT